MLREIFIEKSEIRARLITILRAVDNFYSFGGGRGGGGGGGGGGTILLYVIVV